MNLIIRGRSFGLLCSIGAMDEISEKLVPDHDWGHLDSIFGDNSTENTKLYVQLALILSRWHEASEKYFDPAYEEHPLTPELISYIPDVQMLVTAVVGTLGGDRTGTIDTEEIPTKNARSGGTAR